jgi:hypothetical protein
MAVIPLLAAAIVGSAQGQNPSLRGVVRDTGRAPLAGVDVLVGRRQTQTDAQGVFRVDSLPPGEYVIMVRRIGYTPIRSRVTVGPATPDLEYVLAPAPVLLPALVAEGRRTGIYGMVADSSHHVAVGARVQVAGFQGGEALTDSAGAFAFPRADRGAYLVRVTFPGYKERRLTLELERGQGRELAVRLVPGFETAFHGDESALKDLRLRLSMGFKRERFTAADLALHVARQGKGGLCSVPMNAGGDPVIVVNGIDVYRGMPRTFLCFWNVEDVEMVEFGPDVCREGSGTMAFLIGVSCGGASRNTSRSLGRRRQAQSSGRGYIVIWERR